MPEVFELIQSATDEDKIRFWDKVNKGRDCWLWLAAKKHNGYGAFQFRHHIQVRAHRFVWMIERGAIPAGMYVCHSCDNPSCVRPSHLFLGTTQENTQDRHSKGRDAKGKSSGRVTMPHRTPRGENIGLAKLTEEKVREMRALKASIKISYCELGLRFGVTNANARRAVLGKTWAHVK